MKVLAHGIRLLFLAAFVLLIINGKVMVWLALYVLSLLVAPIFGRVYCGYVCPMNTAMIPAHWLSRKLKWQATHAPKGLKNGILPWIFLLVSMALMLVFKRVLQINFPILPLWLVLSVLVTLRYKPAVFHNLLCPFGAPQKLFARFSLLKKSVDHAACIGCKRCEVVCPSDAIVVAADDRKAVITPALCHQCTSCRDICPTQAIRYSKNR